MTKLLPSVVTCTQTDNDYLVHENKLISPFGD